jgi:hypothetical protein
MCSETSVTCKRVTPFTEAPIPLKLEHMRELDVLTVLLQALAHTALDIGTR